MRYHYDKPKNYTILFGKVYACDHPVYDRCTLYQVGDRGLAVIQQRYDPMMKHTWWTEIDPWLIDIIYRKSKFREYFDRMAWVADEKGLYPTVTVRQLMWAMRMKPLKREPWETVFDKSPF